MTPKDVIAQAEKEMSYIIFKLKNSIRHEIEGTNLGEYKNDVEKYTNESKSFLSSYTKDLLQSVEGAIEEKAKEAEIAAEKADTFFQRGVENQYYSLDMAEEDVIRENARADALYGVSSALSDIINNISKE